MAEARIDVVIGSAQAQSGARAITQAVDMVKQSFVDMAAKAFVFERAMEHVWRGASRGAAFEETMSRLNRQMGAFHGNAQVIVNDIQAISNHTLATADAAQLASRALAAGFNPDQIRTFTRAADMLDDVLGTDLKSAFDQIVQAAMTGRSAVLANIGVYVDLEDEVKQLAASTGRTTEQISRQERAMLTAKAITEQLGRSMGQLTDGAVSDADKLKQIEARWQDVSTSIEISIKNMVIQSMDWLDRLGRKLDSIGFTEEMAKKLLLGPFAQAFSSAPLAERTQALLGPPTAGTPPPPEKRPPLPFELRVKGVEGERARGIQEIRQSVETFALNQDSTGRQLDIDAQRQQITQEELVRQRGTLRRRVLEEERLALDQELELEEAFHRHVLQMEGVTTEARIEENERFKGRRFEILDAINKKTLELTNATSEEEKLRAQARELAESSRGQRTQDRLNAEFRISEDIRQRDLEASELYYRGQIDMALAEFANDEEIARKERVLLREQLAFKLRLSQDEVNRLLFLRKAGDLAGVSQILDRADPTLDRRAREGIIESGDARDRKLAERANGDFFAGWSRGLQDYVQRTEGAFNLANDMARRTAQTMEQGFQRFFFDGMDGKFTRFKDVLTGVLDFTKQIVSQMVAQMMTVGLIKPTAAAVGGFFGGGGGAASTSPFVGPFEGSARFGGVFPVERMAMGGITHRPTMMAFGGSIIEAGEGPQAEAFVPLPDGRSIPVTMRFDRATPSQTVVAAPQVSVPVDIQVINQMPGAQVEASQASGPDGRQQIRLLIRQEMSTALREGAMDQDLRRFGLAPQPVRR